MDKKIYLDVGGTIFVTYWSTLSKAKYFNDPIVKCGLTNYDGPKSGRTMPCKTISNKSIPSKAVSNIQKPYFIDRSPRLFDHVLSYLRDSNYNYPQKYTSELDFFGVTMDNLITNHSDDNNTITNNDNPINDDNNSTTHNNNSITNNNSINHNNNSITNKNSITDINITIDRIIAIDTDFKKMDIINEVLTGQTNYINTNGVSLSVDIALNYIFKDTYENLYFYNGTRIASSGLFVNKISKNKSKIVSTHIFCGQIVSDVFSNFFNKQYEDFEMTIEFLPYGCSTSSGDFCHRKCKIVRDNKINNLDDIELCIDNNTEKFNMDNNSSNMSQMFEVIKLMLVNNMPKIIINYEDNYVYVVHDKNTNSLIIFSNIVDQIFLRNFVTFIGLCLPSSKNGRMQQGYNHFNKVILVGNHTTLIVFR